MKLLFSTLFLLSALIAVQAQKTGSVCISKFDAPTAGEKGLGNPTGGDSLHHYKIQIGDKIVAGSYEKGSVVSGLSLKKRHSIKIFQDGKLIQSFSFSFSRFSNPKLCLYLKDLYKTWQLQELKNSPWCSCN